MILLYKSKTQAIKLIGIEIKNEYFILVSFFIPQANAEKIVLADLDTPGINEKP